MVLQILKQIFEVLYLIPTNQTNPNITQQKSLATLHSRLKIAEARKKKEMEATQVAAGSVADQQQTLVVDLSPTLRTFYGAPHEDVKKDLVLETKGTDDSILNAPTRRLDSFAPPEPTAAEPTAPAVHAADTNPEEGGIKSDELGENKSDDSSGSSVEPRNLLSVFDQEAHQI